MKAFLYVSLIILTTFSIHAQVGIGTTSPASGALLDLDDPNRGLLVPRVTIAVLGTADPVTAPTTGLLVWNIDVSTGAGFHYWNGGAWVPIGSGAVSPSDAWLITGNTNIVDGTHFIGTGAGTNVDVAFRRNNVAAGRIGATSTSLGLGSANTNAAAGTTAIGVNALAVNTLAQGNTAVGRSALGSNNGNGTSFAGENNTAVGINTLGSNTTGRFNSAFGSSALGAQTTAEYNVGIGSNALRDNISGNNNVAIGINALLVNTASGNIAIGLQALDANTTGIGNTAMGSQALGSNITASNSTAIGYNALAASNATNNTAIGYNAGAGLRAQNNIAIGSNAMDGLTSTASDRNLAIGTNALGATIGSTVSHNVAIGYHASLSTESSSNVAIGHEALTQTTTASNNVAIGDGSQAQGNNGGSNTSVGYHAMFNGTGNNNVCIGYQAGAANSTFSNTVLIGSGSTATASNQIVIGAGAASATNAYVNAPSWSYSSDRRLKENINNSALGLDFIETLRPVSYSRLDNENKETEFGFIAQEVEIALSNAGVKTQGIISTTANGMLAVRYNDILPITVKAVQEQQVLIEKLQKDNEELKAVNAAILKRLEALEQNN